MLKGYYFTPVKNQRTSYLSNNGRVILNRLFDEEYLKGVWEQLYDGDWEDIEYPEVYYGEEDLDDELIKNLNILGSKVGKNEELDEHIANFLYFTYETNPDFFKKYNNPIKAFYVWYYISVIKDTDY